MTNALPAPPPMIPQFPPVWADVFGEDDFGIFAECEVKGARFTWRWICPGAFKMGSPDDEQGRWSAEGPQHDVIITRGFWMGETPVTQAQWQAVMENNPSHFKGDARPVEKVSWQDCREFAAKLNELLPGLHAALPSEAQWEYACRAGTQGAFHIEGSRCTAPTGKDPVLDKLGWFDEKISEGRTHDVKEKDAPNAWGLHDMHGNVWEWCRDAWDQEAYKKRLDGIMDPETITADESASRVVRGGSWINQAQFCRAAIRDWLEPADRWSALGLRLSAGQEPAEPPTGERSDAKP
ncbi:MAG: formylglycine-generating enzyme family protein [Verrucomicrobiaceae bacterium]|nr:formylglycine-generating enzyme family protein [Verrucomicrobiaceae bacterium]